MARKDLSTDPINLKSMWGKAKKFYKELKQTGLSDIAIAAILGNMAQESSFNPRARAGSHHGYIQNQKEIVNWVIKNFGGYDHSHQMRYLIAGLTKKLPEVTSQWGRELNSRFTTFLSGLTKNITVAQATKLWETSYEKSGGQALQQRINYAKYFYNQIINESKPTQPQRKVKGKQNTKVVAQQVPQIPYSYEVNIQEQPQVAYNPSSQSASYSSTSSLPLFFDFKDYYPPEEQEQVNAESTKTEFDLPLFATNYKNGGKLIKRGQYGMQVVHTGPFDAEIYLEKDPISHPELQTYIPGLDPEERMDAVVQQLTPQYNPITGTVENSSTYTPTSEQQDLKMIPYDDPSGDILLGIMTLPFGGPAIKYTPKVGQIIWEAIKQTMKNPKPFLKSLAYDTGAWLALNEGTRLATGKTLDQKLNWSMGFPENEGPSFLLTGTAAGIGRRMLGKGINLVGQGIKSALEPTPSSQPFYVIDPDAISSEELANKLIARIEQLKIEEPNLNIDKIPESEIDKYLNLLKKNGFVIDYKEEVPTIVGKVNMQNNPVVQAMINMLNYRIHNKMIPTESSNAITRNLLNLTNGSVDDIVTTSTTPEYVDQLGKTSSLITTISSIDPQTLAASTTTLKTNLTQIGSALLRNIKNIVRTFTHENVGHGLNKILQRFRNPNFPQESMYDTYQALLDYPDSLILQVLDPEKSLSAEELEAALIETLPEFLENFMSAQKINAENLLSLSRTNPAKLDAQFDEFISKMNKEDFVRVVTNSESKYAYILRKLLPGREGLAYKGKMLNFWNRPPDGSYAQDVYDLLTTLKQDNRMYTDKNAENYMNMLKNVIGKGFSISALLSTVDSTQDEVE